jgi:hypothetical protein
MDLKIKRKNCKIYLKVPVLEEKYMQAVYVVGPPREEVDLDTECGVLDAAHQYLLTALALVEAMQEGHRRFYVECSQGRGHLASHILGRLSGRVRTLRCSTIRAEESRLMLRYYAPAYCVVKRVAFERRWRLARQGKKWRLVPMKTLQIPTSGVYLSQRT